MAARVRARHGHLDTQGRGGEREISRSEVLLRTRCSLLFSVDIWTVYLIVKPFIK